MSDNYTLDLWERGHFLHDIALYGRREFIQRLEATVEIATDDIEDAREFAEMMFTEEELPRASKVIDIMERNSYARAQFERVKIIDLARQGAKTFTMQAIKAGCLIGFGYATHVRFLEDLPKQLPSDAWEGEIDWKDSYVSFGNLRFSSVRVVEPPEIMPASPIRIGRPSHEGLIVKAFNWGIENGTIDLALSKRTIYEKVREVIQRQHPNEYGTGKGFGLTPMRKFLSKRIDQLRGR